MSDLNKLRQVIETNFRLNGLQTRELSAQVNRQLTEVGQTMDGLSIKVAKLGQTFQTTMDQQVDRGEETLAAIHKILDH